MVPCFHPLPFLPYTRRNLPTEISMAPFHHQTFHPNYACKSLTCGGQWGRDVSPALSTSPFIPILPAPAVILPVSAKHWIVSNMQIAGSAESDSPCSDYQSIYGSNKNWGCKILFPPLMIWYICSQWSGSQIEQIFIGARKWAVRLSNFQWWILEPIGSTECSDLCPLKQLLFGEQQTPSWNCLIFTVAKKTQFCHGPCWISYLCVNKEDFALS